MPSDPTPSVPAAAHFPYRYTATFTVVVEGDGQHSDGAGAMATMNRLRRSLAADARVLEVRPPVGPHYIGAKPRPTQPR